MPAAGRSVNGVVPICVGSAGRRDRCGRSARGADQADTDQLAGGGTHVEADDVLARLQPGDRAAASTAPALRASNPRSALASLSASMGPDGGRGSAMSRTSTLPAPTLPTERRRAGREVDRVQTERASDPEGRECVALRARCRSRRSPNRPRRRAARPLVVAPSFGDGVPFDAADQVQRVGSIVDREQRRRGGCRCGRAVVGECRRLATVRRACRLPRGCRSTGSAAGRRRSSGRSGCGRPTG